MILWKIKGWLKGAAVVILLAVCGLLLYRSCLSPSHERLWRADNAKLASVDIDDQIVTISNVRDWRYDEAGPISEEWVSESYDLSAIKDMWFIMEPFSALKAVGHGMLMFDFEGGKTVLISVEARKEEGESFSAWKGVLNQFELIYLWGTQEDFLIRRALVQKHPIRLHRLNLQQDTIKEVFLALLKQTNRIKEQPKLYNTLRHNCTNKLAHAANEVNPGSVPKSLSYILTGYADKTLYESGLVHGRETWTEQERASYVHEFITQNYTAGDWPVIMRRKVSP